MIVYSVKNRIFTPSADGWNQILICGDHPGVISTGKDEAKGRERILQVVNEASLEKILVAFNRQKQDADFPGLLVDLEHFSYDPDKSSEAAAWIREMEVRNKTELWAKFDLTDLGEAKIRTGRYRHVSPVLTGGERFGNRIIISGLESVALTNKPNISGMKPLSNREQTQNEGEMNMTKVIELLGLPADAAEDAVAEAVQTLLNRASTAETELTTVKNTLSQIEKEKLEAEADQFCETHKARIKNRDAVRGQYIENKAGTIALFESLAEQPAAPARVLNRTDGKQPSSLPPEDVQDARDEYVGLVQRTHKIKNRTDAFALAKTLKPELFNQ